MSRATLQEALEAATRYTIDDLGIVLSFLGTYDDHSAEEINAFLSTLSPGLHDPLSCVATLRYTAVERHVVNQWFALRERTYDYCLSNPIYHKGQRVEPARISYLFRGLMELT